MKRVEEIETMMDDAITRKEHQKIKKLRHGPKGHDESRLRIRVTELLNTKSDDSE